MQGDFVRIRGWFLPQVGNLDWLALRESSSNVRLIEANALTGQRVNQLLIHPVGGTQLKFALHFSKT